MGGDGSGSAPCACASQETRREEPHFKQEADDVRDEETLSELPKEGKSPERARAKLVIKTQGLEGANEGTFY